MGISLLKEVIFTIKVTIISAKYGDKVRMLEKNDVIELRDKNNGFQILQNGKIVKDESQLVDDTDAYLVPTIHGGAV